MPCRRAARPRSVFRSFRPGAPRAFFENRRHIIKGKRTGNFFDFFLQKANGIRHPWKYATFKKIICAWPRERPLRCRRRPAAHFQTRPVPNVVFSSSSLKNNRLLPRIAWCKLPTAGRRKGWKCGTLLGCVFSLSCFFRGGAGPSPQKKWGKEN